MKSLARSPRSLLAMLFIAALGSIAPQVVRAAEGPSPQRLNEDLWVDFSPIPEDYQITGIYDPVRDQMVVARARYNDDVQVRVWGLSFQSAGWRPIGAPNPALAGSSVIYDPVDDRMILFGGFTGSGHTGETWAVDLDDGSWSPLSAGPQRAYHTAIYDPVRHRMLVFGGDRWGQDGSYGDVWELSLSGTPAWTPVAVGPELDGHSAIYDPVRDRMIVYGGSNDGVLNAQVFALNLSSAPSWSTIPAAPIPARSAHRAVYDPLRDAMVVFGGSKGANTRTDETWVLSLAVPAWTLATAGVGPSPRTSFAAAHDPSRDRMVIFGGHPGSPSDGLGDSWELSLSTMTWSRYQPFPEADIEHASVFDPVRNRVLVLGGSAGGIRLNDVWTLPANNLRAGTKLTPAGSPPDPRMGHSAIYDPTRDRVVVFGGLGSSLFNDTWVLQLSGTPTWSPLTTTGTLPLPRHNHSAIYDPLRDRMIIYGGSGPGSDLWELTFSGTPHWAPLATTGITPLARTGQSAIYDPNGDRMLVFGGTHHLVNSDLMSLSLSGTPRWSGIPLGGTGPSPRSDHSAVYDPVGRRMLVLGGYSGSATSNGDLWELNLLGDLSWTNITPAEGPPTRSGHTAVYNPVSPGMVVYGGSSQGDLLWEFNLESSVADVPVPIHPELALHGVRPNPMRSSGGVVAFSLAGDQPAAIELIDVAGRRVWSRDVGTLGAGRHTVTLPSDRGRKPGIYFLRLSSGNRSVTTKAVLTD